jgi:prophage regulatory protein
MLQRFLRRREVEKITGLSRATIYGRMEAGRFPRPVPLGGTAVGWPENEIEAWCKTRLRARDAGERSVNNGWKPGVKRKPVVDDDVPVPSNGWRSS